MFIAKAISPFVNKSTTFGRPSLIFKTDWDLTPALINVLCVPPVAKISKPNSINSLANFSIKGLSKSVKEIKTFPLWP